MEKPILYIHGGTNKTGTTSIQSFLALNYDVLLSLSVLYPKTGRDELIQHHYLFSSIRNPEHPYFIPKKTYDEYLIDLSDEIVTNHPEKVILSSEMFGDLMYQNSTVLKEKLSKLFNLFSSVKVIFYIRRPDKYAMSMNNTQIWYGKKKKHDLNFPKILEWTKHIEKDQLIFRPFEKGQFIDGELYYDFLETVNIKNKEPFELPSKYINESINDDVVELCRIINNAHPDITKNNQFKNIILEAFHYAKGAKNAFFSPKERLKIIEEFEDDLRIIAKDYLGREDGILFYEPLPNPDEQWESYKGLPLEKVVHAFSYLLYKNNEKIIKQQDQINILLNKQTSLNTTIEFQQQQLKNIEKQLKELMDEKNTSKNIFGYLKFLKK